LIHRTWQHEPARNRPLEHPARIVSFIADKDHRRKADLPADADRPFHQLEGDAVSAPARRNSKRTQKRRSLVANADGPEAYDPRHALFIDRDKARLWDGPVSFAQALGRLGEAPRSKHLIEQGSDSV